MIIHEQIILLYYNYVINMYKNVFDMIDTENGHHNIIYTLN